MWRKAIHQSHMIGALYGMERMMGKDHTPVRNVLDYALKHFLSDRPIPVRADRDDEC